MVVWTRPQQREQIKKKSTDDLYCKTFHYWKPNKQTEHMERETLDDRPGVVMKSALQLSGTTLSHSEGRGARTEKGDGEVV